MKLKMEMFPLRYVFRESLSELAIYGAPKTDWLGVIEEYLIDHEWHTNRLFRAVREAAVSFQLLASKSGPCYTLHVVY